MRARAAATPSQANAGDRRGLIVRFGCGALALAMMVIIYQLLNAPNFKVGRIEVTGQNLLTQGEVVQAAGILGASVFSVDRDRVGESVNGLGTLKAVSVAVALPDLVRIAVVENVPRYVWQTATGAYLVDERGVVLGAARGQPTLPAVQDPQGVARKRGDKVDLPALEAAARLASLWPARLGQAPACEYGTNGLALVGEGWRAELGEGANLAAKVLALGAVLDHVEQEGVELTFVDLRLPERPYYK